MVGTAASLALGTWLLNEYGFFTAIFSLSLTVVLIMLVPLLLRERPGERLLRGRPVRFLLTLPNYNWAASRKSLPRCSGR